MKCLGRTTALALAAAASFTLAACQTDEIKGNVLVVSRVVDGTTPASGLGAWLSVFVARDDCSLEQQDCPSQRLRIDGQFVVWDDTVEYLSISGLGMVGFVVPPGNHVIDLVTMDGQVLAQSAAQQMKSDMMHNLIVFGTPDDLRMQWLVDDPAQVPAGVVRARLVNALSSRDPIQPVRCTTPQGPCTALSQAPLAHGEIFEVDSPPETAVELGWKWAGPGAVDPVFVWMVRPFEARQPPTYVLDIPIRVGSDGCPSCPRAQYNQ